MTSPLRHTSAAGANGPIEMLPLPLLFGLETGLMHINAYILTGRKLHIAQQYCEGARRRCGPCQIPGYAHAPIYTEVGSLHRLGRYLLEYGRTCPGVTVSWYDKLVSSLAVIYSTGYQAGLSFTYAQTMEGLRPSNPASVI